MLDSNCALACTVSMGLKHHPEAHVNVSNPLHHHRTSVLFNASQACLAWWNVVSPFGGFGSTAALAFVLIVAAVKAIFEDKKRHQEDHRTNKSTAHVVHADGNLYLCWPRFQDFYMGDFCRPCCAQHDSTLHLVSLTVAREIPKAKPAADSYCVQDIKDEVEIPILQSHLHEQWCLLSLSARCDASSALGTVH